MEPVAPILGTVSRDGDQVVIRLHRDRAHDLRVALAACPCTATKSTEGQALREALAQAIGKATR
ncbi:MAG: hypothetical protein MUE98_13470 [Rhodobacteraceae bacterium]|nr:hypothetical protein [Paracoccaceae bacterium]